MGGIDKGLALYRGRPLIEWVIERVRPQVDDLHINANRNAERYAAYRLPVIPDLIEGFPGPLAGVHTALLSATHDWVLTIPCDTPSLPEDLVARLIQRTTQPDVEIVVAATSEGWQPTVALYKKSLSADLSQLVLRGERRVKNWILNHTHEVVPFDLPSAFANLNTPGDF